MSVGERIRISRKAAGLTQKELGQKLGVSASMIGQYETDLRKPKLDTVIKIADALGISTTELLDVAPTDSDLKSLFAVYMSLYDILRKTPKEDGRILLSEEERSKIKEHAKTIESFTQTIISNDTAFSTYVKDVYESLFDKLNLDGQCIAVKMINELASNPEYQAK